MLVDESRKMFWENLKLVKFSSESETFFGNRGKSETEGNASLPQRGWTPLGWSNATVTLRELD